MPVEQLNQLGEIGQRSLFVGLTGPRTLRRKMIS